MRKAVEQGLRTARLPIDEYVRLQTRKVLTVNQVFEILMEYRGHHDWRRAFHAVIPERKFQGANGADVSVDADTSASASVSADAPSNGGGDVRQEEEEHQEPDKTGAGEEAPDK